MAQAKPHRRRVAKPHHGDDGNWVVSETADHSIAAIIEAPIEYPTT